MRSHDYDYRTDAEHRLVAKLRRDMLRAAGLCIAGPLIQGAPGKRKGVVHGLPVSGGRCARCAEVAKLSR